MDKITLTGMQFYGYHGVYPEENKLGQRYVIDVELLLPLGQAGVSDRIEETINYAEVVELTRKFAEQRTFKLIEALAENVASAILTNYTVISEVTVRVHKPHPPVNIQFQGVAVEIHRKRAEA